MKGWGTFLLILGAVLFVIDCVWLGGDTVFRSYTNFSGNTVLYDAGKGISIVGWIGFASLAGGGILRWIGRDY